MRSLLHGRINCSLHIFDTPIGLGAVGHIGIGEKPQLITGHLKPHIERLVEVRAIPEELGPPRPGRSQIRCRIDDRAESEQFLCHERSLTPSYPARVADRRWIEMSPRAARGRQ